MTQVAPAPCFQLRRPRFVRVRRAPGSVQKRHTRLPVLAIIGVEETADTGLATGDADDDLVVDGEGATVIEWPVLFVGDDDIPADGAGFGVEGEEMGVDGANIDEIAEDGDAAVHAWEAKVQHARRNRTAPLPDWPAASEIERDDVGGSGCHVHDTIGDGRCAFQLFGAWRLIHPERPEPADRLCRDLREPREAVCAIRPAVHQPMTVIGRVARQPRRRDLRENDWRKNHTRVSPCSFMTCPLRLAR